MQFPFVKNSKGIEIPFPSFISSEYNSKLFTVKTDDFGDLGLYDVGWKLGFKEFPELQVSCETRLEVKYLPSFTGDKISDQTLSCYENWTLQVPAYTDGFGKPATMKIDLGETNDFL